MPDLITHTAVAYFAVRPFKLFPRQIVFFVGTILPDVITRPIYILKPDWYPFTVAMHTPAFCIVTCLLLAEFFSDTIRGSIRKMLLLGIALHFFLDLFQKHLGMGYLWGFPFSWRSFELGLWWPEQSLYAIPILLLAVGSLELLMKRMAK